MTTITRELLAQVRDDMNAALAPIAKKHGLKSLACGRCTFFTGTFTMKVEGIQEGALDKDAEAYNQLHAMHGLPKLGTTLTIPNDGHTYKIVGMTRGGKVVAERIGTGKRYTIRKEAVKLFLLAQERRAKAAA